ncbi:MAG: KilA-N domain-containing protein [Rickettsiales bacterium]
MTPKKWIDATHAKGIISKPGRYGCTYAHHDIAFEFGSWISPAFKLYLITEYERLKD